MARKNTRKTHLKEILLAAAVLLVVAVAEHYLGPLGTPPTGSVPNAPSESESSVAQAYAQRRSEVWMTVEGRVSKLLSDDNEGDRHQRFLVQFPDGLSLLVAHNIDLARRVPLGPGDHVRMRGRYEWNEKGGVLHWTHHDPSGYKAGGWIEHEGNHYK